MSCSRSLGFNLDEGFDLPRAETLASTNSLKVGTFLGILALLYEADDGVMIRSGGGCRPSLFVLKVDANQPEVGIYQ